MKSMNTKYKYNTNLYVLNTVLHHVGMLWITKTNIHLEYDADKNNPYWMTGDAKNYMEKFLKNLL